MEAHDLFGSNMKIRFKEDLKKTILEKLGNTLDLVIFTGDLTQKGSDSEFKRVNEFLDELWTFFDREVQISSRPKLLAVPGNHDLVRPQGTQEPNDKVFHDWLREFWEKDPSSIKAFWENGTFGSRKIISESFANYEDWWENQTDRRPTGINKGIIPGDFSFSYEKEGAKLGILGLNTSFLQLTNDDYQGKLNLDVRQFHQACNNDGPNWAREHHICMLLTHHPPSWLHDKSQTQFREEIINNNNFAVHLCGHLHEASYREYAEGGTEAHRTWQGRSLFGIEYYDHRQGKPIERLHGYTLGQINLNGRNKAKLIFCPREVRKQGHDRNFIPDFFCKLDEKTLHTNPKELTLLQQYENDIEEENDNGSQDINRDNYQELVKSLLPQYQEQQDWKGIHEKLQLFCKKLGNIDQYICGFTQIVNPKSSDIDELIEDLRKEVKRRKKEIENIKIEDLKTLSVRNTINCNLESTNWLTNIKELIDKIFREINKFSATDNEDTTNENERNSLTIKNYTSNLKNKLIHIIRNECLLQLQNQSNAFLAFIDTELKTSMDLFEQKLRKLEKDYESIK
jgi:predicted phosphodiesterase